jgi:peptide methionine sulfoxide reductase msrA/msrB
MITFNAYAWMIGFLALAGSLFACGQDGPQTPTLLPFVMKANETPESAPARPRISRSRYDVTPLSKERVAELAKKLTPEQYNVTQKAGTEAAFCGNLTDNKKDGIYLCIVCGLPLFRSEDKFHSGTGWPSFFQTFDREHVVGRRDDSHGMDRISIECARCTAHLGHVFDDGPRPTGMRFCLNSASLTFVEKGKELPADARPIAKKLETAYFAGGCFWGVEHYFQLAPGVINVVSGFMQGSMENPTYKDVCNDETGHAETVMVEFDPETISFRDLLRGFFEMHDPTQMNRQGPDFGSQYRSGVWCVDDKQLNETKAFIAELEAKKAFGGKKVVTQVEKAKKFYAAEDYHQDYIEKTGRECHVTKPWWLRKEK